MSRKRKKNKKNKKKKNYNCPSTSSVLSRTVVCDDTVKFLSDIDDRFPSISVIEREYLSLSKRALIEAKLLQRYKSGILSGNMSDEDSGHCLTNCYNHYVLNGKLLECVKRLIAGIECCERPSGCDMSNREFEEHRLNYLALCRNRVLAQEDWILCYLSNIGDGSDPNG